MNVLVFYSIGNGHLGGSQFGAIINKAAMNICAHVFVWTYDCVDHSKLWKILKEMGIPDHLTCLLRNLYAGQEAIVRTGHGTTD